MNGCIKSRNAHDQSCLTVFQYYTKTVFWYSVYKWVLGMLPLVTAPLLRIWRWFPGRSFYLFVGPYPESFLSITDKSLACGFILSYHLKSYETEVHPITNFSVVLITSRVLSLNSVQMEISREILSFIFRLIMEEQHFCTAKFNDMILFKAPCCVRLNLGESVVCDHHYH